MSRLQSALARMRAQRPRRRRALPRPRPLQGRQRQPRPRRRRPAAARASPSACAPCVRAGRHRRPLRRRRVRRPAARTSTSAEDAVVVAQRVARGAPQPVRARRTARSSSAAASASPVDRPHGRDRRGADPRRRRRHVPRQGAAARPLSSLRRRCCATAPSPAMRSRPTCARAHRARRARRPLPAELSTRDRRGSSASRRWSAGTTPSAACVPPGEFIPLAEETGLIVADRRAGCCARPAARRRAGSAERPAARRARQPLRRASSPQPGLRRRPSRHALSESGLAPERCSPRDHRERRARGRRPAASPRSRRCATSACSSRSTTSAPATRSLSYLRRLPIDASRSTARSSSGLGSDGGRRPIVDVDHRRSPARSALSVVAEGVETEEQLAGLRAPRLRHDAGLPVRQAGPAADVAALVGERDASVTA